MHDEFLNIRTVLNIDQWQKIQDELASVTGMAIVTVDYKGEPVTTHSGLSKFCEIIRNDPKMSKKCQKCDARGGFEAARINGVYIYRCHYDIIDAAAPIVAGDKFIGAVMMGQVLIKGKASDEHEYLETIYTKSTKLEFDQHGMEVHFDRLPKMSYRQIREKINMVYNISNYIVAEAINKYSLNQENLKLTEKLELYHTRAGSGMLYGREKEEDGISHGPDNSILEPAITYIHEHLSENVSLKDAAAMCFISPSYFSKLFYEELGENFSTYVTIIKIDQAKILLRETTKLIKDIALELGFNDESYFIKQFRHNEGITPGAFRRNANKKIKNHEIIIK